MAEENRNGASELLEKGANAASAIRGAVKTGKAIADIARGTAAGGPFGAAAGLLWANRKTVAKVAAALAGLLALPVLFLMMLPSIVFGDMSENPAIPVLNDNAAILANIESAESAVRKELIAGHDSLLEDIQSDFESESNGGGRYRMSVIDSYTDEILFNSVLILSQYCASVEDYTQISTQGLADTVAAHIGGLFSYTLRTWEETVEVEVPLPPDPEDESGETGTTTRTETVHVYEYTVEYAGDCYFADGVFFLNDEQKALADNYAANRVSLVTRLWLSYS